MLNAYVMAGCVLFEKGNLRLNLTQRVSFEVAAKEPLMQDRMMSDQELLERISSNPKVMVGQPVIKGTRLTVGFILNLLAHGSTEQDILSEYEGLFPEDIQACLLFASQSLSDTSFMPLAMETA
jgi:uncharacterized protein (DUF433 family)